MKKQILAIAATIAFTLPAAAQTMDNDHMDLSSIVSKVETESASHVMQAEMEYYKGQPAYEVDVVKGDKVMTMYVNAQTGETIATDEPRIENAFRKVFDRELKMFREINQPLAARLSAIETETNGKIREVDFDVEDDMPIWEMEIDMPNGEAEVKVNAKTGQMIETEFDD